MANCVILKQLCILILFFALFQQGKLQEHRGIGAQIRECLEEPICPNFFEHRFPTPDGRCNNRVNPKWGAGHRSFKRLIPPDYADDHGSLRVGLQGSPLPPPRNISNALQESLNTSTSSTHMIPFWGQFLVHDIALTEENEDETLKCNCIQASSPECINIKIPSDDVQFQNAKKTCFPLKRSAPALDSDQCNNVERQQLNEISAFMDMGIIYSNSEEHMEAIRQHSHFTRGQLITVQSHFAGFGEILADTNYSLAIAPAADTMGCPAHVRKPPDVKCRVTGEIRANENSVLLSHHTVWTRMHNSVAKSLKNVNPEWSSDSLFQTAKQITTALHQQVTFKHFLPVIIGDQLMKEFGLTLLENGYYYGYDSSYDATVSNSFATAAFRMGHTLINQIFRRPSAAWDSPQADEIRVKTSLFNIDSVTNVEGSGGPNSFIRGLANDSALTFDSTFSDDLRNFLNAPNTDPAAYGSDLLSINIQRGRDHGIPAYVKYRKFCGLSVPRSFSDLADTTNPGAIEKLKSNYGDVEEIDLYAGGISEHSVEGGTVGPTFACLIAYQFRDLKKGDRFWHENPPPFGTFSAGQLKAIRAMPFPTLLCDMISDMESIQPWPMKKLSEMNQRKPCKNYPPINFSAWKDPLAIDRTDHIEQDVEKTSWFPFDIVQRNFNGNLTSSDLYLWLLTNRPSEVCRQVLDTEGRKVNGRIQFRFHCLPGSISHSDFPQVLSSQYKFTDWYPGVPIRGGVEVNLPHDCTNPFAIQAQSRGGEPASRSDAVFSRFSATEGLLCYDDEQKTGILCGDYRVRFLCRK